MRDLSLYVMDIAQNSLDAGADLVGIGITENTSLGTMEVKITDNGAGMTAREAVFASDPFYTTKLGRITGMGLSLFKMSAELTGGDFGIESEKGAGTSVFARYNTGHIDMPPAGDIEETVRLLRLCNPGALVEYIYTKDDAAAQKI